MCYVREMSISDTVLLLATPDLVIDCIKNKSVTRVIFHSLQPQSYSLIDVIKEKTPECRIDWIYWGESYDGPSRLMCNKTLIEYLNERGIPDWLSMLLVRTKLAHILIDARAARFRNKVSRCILNIDTMYHWSQIDYEHVKALFRHKKLRFDKFFYDVVDTQMINSNLVEQDLECVPAECIVVGHSASFRNNHLDILPAVVEYATKRNKTLICPFSYGSATGNYLDKIEKNLNKIPRLSYRILYKFYPVTDYLSFLSKCGAYVAPGCGSVGAGNMVSYALSGRVPIIAYGNTTGEFLKSLGAEVAIYNDIRDISIFLEKFFGVHSEKNRIIVGDYFSAINKVKCYENLLAIV